MKKLLFRTIQAILLGSVFSVTLRAQNVMPVENAKGNYYFNIADVYFEVDPSFGSRISSLKIDGNEIMFVDSTLNGGHVWGSNLWPSPQSWGWPPSVELDNNPYTGGIAGDSVSLLSEVDATYNSHLQFRKTFTASLSDTSVTIRYTMINTGSTANSFSPWELTRAPSGGMAFFPYGAGDITGAFASQVQKVNNVAWYKYKNTDPSSQKFFSDGSEGWFAYVNDSKEIFIRKFKDVAADKQAPGEAEIELWFNSPSTYIEMEVQGEYKNIPAGGSVDWTDKWYVRNLPNALSDTLGSPSLISYVRDIIKDRPVSVENQEIAQDEFLVYPNPVSEILTVECQVSPDNTEFITIYDIQGRISLQQKLDKQISVLNVNSLPDGLYFYQIFGENIKGQTGKLIVWR
jgi:hypothetical protein